MDFKVHLISGLPRSGSTLLSAILRQNPRFQAGMSGPLADILVNLVQVMSSHESAIFISDAQREKILKSVVGAYYCGSTGKVIFDTNRRWCGLLSLVVQLLPGSLVICCVRNPAWIIDSVERLVQRNPLLVPKMFGHEVIDVYRRAEYLTTKGFLAPAANGLKQAWYGDNAGRLMAIRYESLAQRPAEVIRSLYEHLDEPLFEHDFENVEYDVPEFDTDLRMPGLHRVTGRVEMKTRETILPPELFSQYDQCFWDMPDQNPHSVRVL